MITLSPTRIRKLNTCILISAPMLRVINPCNMPCRLPRSLRADISTPSPKFLMRFERWSSGHGGLVIYAARVARRMVDIATVIAVCQFLQLSALRPTSGGLLLLGRCQEGGRPICFPWGLGAAPAFGGAAGTNLPERSH